MSTDVQSTKAGAAATSVAPTIRYDRHRGLHYSHLSDDATEDHNDDVNKNAKTKMTKRSGKLSSQHAEQCKEVRTTNLSSRVLGSGTRHTLYHSIFTNEEGNAQSA